MGRYRGTHISCNEEEKLAVLSKFLAKGSTQLSMANYFTVSTRTIRNWKKRLAKNLNAEAFDPDDVKRTIKGYLKNQDKAIQACFKVMHDESTPVRLRIRMIGRITKLLDQQQAFLIRFGYYDMYKKWKEEKEIFIKESNQETEMLYRNVCAEEDGLPIPFDIEEWKARKDAERLDRWDFLRNVHTKIWG